ncbi:MAG TPA: transcription antitermination factor NusB [Clostridia bacterium]|nr:transcription antitermination factor NusB [Clostridia bacterium]
MSRKTAREVAMMLIFARMLGGEDEYRCVLDQSGIMEEPPQEDIDFADSLVLGIEANKEQIDRLIAQSAIGWTINRMPNVDLCILRIALYEMMYRSDIPHSVSINEAVELAKRFAGDKSPAYINGILGTLSKELSNSTQI